MFFRWSVRNNLLFIVVPFAFPPAVARLARLKCSSLRRSQTYGGTNTVSHCFFHFTARHQAGPRKHRPDRPRTSDRTATLGIGMSQEDSSSGTIRLPPRAPGLKIGLFGGTFDPPHAAHRAACLLAMQRLGLDRVWW